MLHILEEEIRNCVGLIGATRLSELGREYLTRAPWIMLAPATTIVLTTLAVSMVGDWLRDRLDPT